MTSDTKYPTANEGGQEDRSPDHANTAPDRAAIAGSDRCLLRPYHAQYLAAHGIPLDLALRAGLQTVDGISAGRLLGTNVAYPSNGIAVPYPPLPQTGLQTWRVLFDDPVARGSRWLSQESVPARPYLPCTVPPEVWRDIAVPLCMVEGPIVALAMSAAGFAAVGLEEVHTGGHDSEDPARNRSDAIVPAELRSSVLLENRRITILFNAARAWNPIVALREAHLASVLEAAGANVYVAALPSRRVISPTPGPEVRHG